MTAYSLQDIAGARHREGLRAAGANVAGDSEEDRKVLKAAGVKRRQKGREVKATSSPVVEEEVTPRLPAYLEIAASESDHAITIHHKDGTSTRVEAVSTAGDARMMGWYQTRLNQLSAELGICDDEAEANRIDAEISRLNDSRYRRMLANLPDGELDRLDPAQSAALSTMIELIGQEVLAEVRAAVGKVKGQLRPGR